MVTAVAFLGARSTATSDSSHHGHNAVFLYGRVGTCHTARENFEENYDLIAETQRESRESI